MCLLLYPFDLASSRGRTERRGTGSSSRELALWLCGPLNRHHGQPNTRGKSEFSGKLLNSFFLNFIDWSLLSDVCACACVCLRACFLEALR